jgi:ankyrin repeat protein
VNDPTRLPVRVLPARPNLDHLKRQAKELLAAFRAGDPAATAEVRAHYRGADPATFALHLAQLVLARAYGFDSWPNLKAFVERGTGGTLAIRPVELQSPQGEDVWDTLVAASAGDLVKLRELLARNRRLARAEYWYTPVLHFAVRDGHIEAVQLLLEAGADPERNGLSDQTLAGMARDRGHEAIAALLDQRREVMGRVRAQPANHPVHRAAARGDVANLRAQLDADESLANLGSSRGMTPLHLAVLSGNLDAVSLLLERGADLHAWSREDMQAIDFAVFGDNQQRSHFDVARLLVAHGAAYDLTIAAASGDIATVRRMLADGVRIDASRPAGRRPLSSAVRFGHDDIVRLLLEQGANPQWEESNDAPHGTSLHWASRRGNLAIVQLLLQHGADPNEPIDSTSSPANWAPTEEIRALITSQGGDSGIYDPGWVASDPELLKRVAASPAEHMERIGAAFVMSVETPDLLRRLLDAGLRMPTIFTSCQTYLLDPDALRALLAHGMSPDQMNWQHQTLLHHAAAKDTPECAAILLDAGATLNARDDEHQSTPLAWAARANKPRMVEFLLSRGASVQLPDDPAWATPMAWAQRRGHQQVVAILRAHGA